MPYPVKLHLPYRHAAAFFALTLLLGLAGCQEGGRPRGPVPVILISIDTLRMDHLGCYGYGPPTSPRLDAGLCRDSVVFEQAISHAPSTLLSHASMLTGLIPARHGGSIELKRGLAPEVRTLAEALTDAGYRTASFNNGGQISATWGIDQGFEVYRSVSADRFAVVVDRALDWIDATLAEAGNDGDSSQTQADRLFLFLHTYETHHPYTPSPADLERVGAEFYDGPLGQDVGYRELRRINNGAVEATLEDKRFIVSAYDAEIRSVDRSLGELMSALAERDLYDRALILFVSDHGEEFGEHGWMGWHSHTLYDELLRVPLIVKLPGARSGGQRVTRQVRLADLTPTVLDLIGSPVPPGLDGTSLLPLIDGEPDGRRPVISQRDGRPSSSIRTSEWKLWDQRLYHLASDPAERRDVARQNEAVVDTLDKRRTTALDGARKGGEVELSPEEMERLKALGYL